MAQVAGSGTALGGVTTTGGVLVGTGVGLAVGSGPGVRQFVMWVIQQGGIELPEETRHS